MQEPEIGTSEDRKINKMKCLYFGSLRFIGQKGCEHPNLLGDMGVGWYGVLLLAGGGRARGDSLDVFGGSDLPTNAMRVFREHRQGQNTKENPTPGRLSGEGMRESQEEKCG